MGTEQQELVEQEDEKALVPTQHKTSDGEIMVIVGFASAVPALWLDVALNLGLPGFVVGALLVTVLALGGPAAVRRMGWAKLGLDLDWNRLFDTVSSLDAPHASMVVESTVNRLALQAALDTDLPHVT